MSDEDEDSDGEDYHRDLDEAYRHGMEGDSDRAMAVIRGTMAVGKRVPSKATIAGFEVMKLEDLEESDKSEHIPSHFQARILRYNAYSNYTNIQQHALYATTSSAPRIQKVLSNSHFVCKNANIYLEIHVSRNGSKIQTAARIVEISFRLSFRWHEGPP